MKKRIPHLFATLFTIVFLTALCLLGLASCVETPPAEIGSEIALEDDEKALFTVYDKARYAGQRGVEEITDTIVGELQLVNRKRNQ